MVIPLSQAPQGREAVKTLGRLLPWPRNSPLTNPREMASGKPVKFVIQKCDTHLNDVVGAHTDPAHVLAGFCTSGDPRIAAPMLPLAIASSETHISDIDTELGVWFFLFAPWAQRLRILNALADRHCVIADGHMTVAAGGWQ